MKEPLVPFFPSFRSLVDEAVNSFPFLLSRLSKTIQNQFFQALLLFMFPSPVKVPWAGHTVAVLCLYGGHVVHTQVPWWCTMCLRCFRPRPLSLKSITRCCDVSTRALAIAIPRGKRHKGVRRVIYTRYIGAARRFWLSWEKLFDFSNDFLCFTAQHLP